MTVDDRVRGFPRRGAERRVVVSGAKGLPTLFSGLFVSIFRIYRENLMIGNIFLITFLTFAAFAAVVLEDRKEQLEVVQTVDLNRYVGRWYEISRLPNSFQKKCADTVTADYTMRAD